MKIGIMQPYLFPYQGYFQLIGSVDKFIFLDDVNFIKGGWINRNRILINSTPTYITVPLQKASQNSLINTVKVNKGETSWKKKILKSLEMNYSKASQFKLAFPIVEKVFLSDQDLIGELAKVSIGEVLTYLEIKTQIIGSSTIYKNSELKFQQRIIDICKKENASKYHNLIGGQEIYDKGSFEQEKINLNFIQSEEIKYKQMNNVFHSNLSMIDLLMHCSKDEINDILEKYSLV